MAGRRPSLKCVAGKSWASCGDDALPTGEDLAINNAALYLGQAIRSGTGGCDVGAGSPSCMGFVRLAHVALSFGVLWLTGGPTNYALWRICE
jgi:hypothetical protein